MKVTYRDAITTVLAALVVAVTLAVTEGWAWPMLGSTRAGIVGVGILGVAMCSIGTRSEDMATRDVFVHHPGMIVGSALGTVALVLLIAGLIAGTEALLIVLAGDWCCSGRSRRSGTRPRVQHRSAGSPGSTNRA